MNGRYAVYNNSGDIEIERCDTANEALRDNELNDWGGFVIDLETGEEVTDDDDQARQR